MAKLKGLDWLALILLIVGGLAWGVAGLFEVIPICGIFGKMATTARVIYILVGLAAIWMVGISGKLARK